MIHIGFGTIISSMDERRAAKQGLTVGHWHLHLYFPTVTLERGGDNETVIEDGRLLALDDPGIRKLGREARRPRPVADESGSRRCPASTCAGDYWRHYAQAIR